VFVQVLILKPLRYAIYIEYFNRMSVTVDYLISGAIAESD